MKGRDMVIGTVFKNANGYLSLVYHVSNRGKHVMNTNGSIYIIKQKSDFSYDEVTDVSAKKFCEMYNLSFIHDWRRREQIEHILKTFIIRWERARPLNKLLLLTL